MKTAIYIEDGVTQLVITPETKFEKAAIDTLRGNSIKCEVHDGSFYDCRGGWVRQTAYYGDSSYHHGGHADDKSLIIKVESSKE